MAWLNELPDDEAVYVLTECSGSRRWATSMAATRPFPMLEDLFNRAEILWDSDDLDDLAAVEMRLTKLLER